MARRLNDRQQALANRFLGAMDRGDSKGMWDVLEEASANDSARAAEAARARSARVASFIDATEALAKGHCNTTKFRLSVASKRGGRLWLKAVSYGKGWDVLKWVWASTPKEAYQWGPVSVVEVGKQLAAQYGDAQAERIQ